MLTPFPSSLLPFLQSLEARSRLGDEERQAVLELPFHPRHLTANQDFVHQGETVAHSSFVLGGLVGTFGQNKRGDRQITSVFMGGDMIDLNSVVVPEAFAALQALVPTTVLQVPHSALRTAAAKYPVLAEAFWRECVIDAAILNEWVMNVGRRDARSRLAHLFCELACRTGRRNAGNGYSFPFPITQNQLADMVGMTPVHVNRTLKGMRADGMVDLVQRTVQILNWDRLTQVGEFDSAYLHLCREGEPDCEATTSRPPPMRMGQ